MIIPGGFAFVAAAVLCWFGLGMLMLRRNDSRLIAARANMTRDAFIAALDQMGADADIAARTFDWISNYYGPKAGPNIEDLMDKDIAIDPGDMEDFVEQFFVDHRMPEPTKENPEVLPDYRETTLRSFVLYLTRRRSELLDREAISV